MEQDLNNLILPILNCTPEEFHKTYKAYKAAEEKFNKIYLPFKENLIKLHETNKEVPNTISIDGVKLIYVSPSVRTTIDTKKLKEEEPDLIKKFSKITNVKASIRID